MVHIERETNKLDKHRKSDLGFVNTKVCIIDSLLVSGSQVHKYLIVIYLDSWRAAMSKNSRPQKRSHEGNRGQV